MELYKGFEIHEVKMACEAGERVVGIWAVEAAQRVVTVSAPTKERAKAAIDRYAVDKVVETKVF